MLPTLRQQTTMNTTADLVDIIIGPITLAMVIIGLFGNGLSFAVMCSNSFKDHVLSIVIQTLAVCDSLYILTTMFMNKWFPQFVGTDVKTISIVLCRGIIGTNHISVSCSNWLVAVIALERYIVIRFPYQSRWLLTKKSVGICISIITIINTSHTWRINRKTTTIIKSKYRIAHNIYNTTILILIFLHL